MKSKAFAFTICSIAILIIVNFFAIKLLATPYSTDIPDGFGQQCFQTMGYCNLSLTYKCIKSHTAESCRIFVCNDCDPAGTDLPTD